MSNTAAETTAGDEVSQLVTFRLKDETYGINVMQVQEVLRVTEIAPVPGAAGRRVLDVAAQQLAAGGDQLVHLLLGVGRDGLGKRQPGAQQRPQLVLGGDDRDLRTGLLEGGKDRRGADP